MTTNHRLKALEHLEAVQIALHSPDDLRMLPDSNQRATRINRTHEQIRQGLKLAEVYATIAISDRLAGLEERVDFLIQEQSRARHDHAPIAPSCPA